MLRFINLSQKLISRTCNTNTNKIIFNNFLQFATSTNNESKVTLVADETINITFIDCEGKRSTVPAKIGQTLLEIADNHKIELLGPCRGGGGVQYKRHSEFWTEAQYGEGPQCYHCHVQIPDQWLDTESFQATSPLYKSESEILEYHWDEMYTKNSRLGCQVKVGREQDGMVVYIPDGPPDDMI